MKRKVNLVGKNTLTVSLPSKWAEKNNIVKGNELELVEDGSKLLLLKGDYNHKEKKFSFSVDDMNKYSLIRYLTVLYRTGYKRIQITYTKSSIEDLKTGKTLLVKSLISKFCDRFIGMDIVSQTSNRTEIVCFLLSHEENLKSIEKRISFLLYEMIEEFLLSLDNDEHSVYHSSVYDHHDNVVKYINYFLRKLNFIDMEDSEKNHLFALYMVIDHVVDKLRHLSEMVSKYGLSKKARTKLVKILDLFHSFIESAQKASFSNELIKKRYDLFKSLRRSDFDVKDLWVLSEISHFMDLINIFYEYIVIHKINLKS